jgi:hypothetical protein
MFQSIEDLAKDLNVSSDRAEELLKSNAISLGEVDAVILELLRGELSTDLSTELNGVGKKLKTVKPIPLQQGKAGKASQLALQTKPPTASPPHSGSTRQEAINVVNAPNEAIQRTLQKAQKLASDRLQAKEETAAVKIADQIVAKAEAELDQATDFLLQALGGGWLTQAIEGAAIEAGWIEAEVVEEIEPNS